MRSLTLAMYVVAVGLTYVMFQRAAGVVTAAVATVLTATLPIHVHYSHFPRTESLGLVLTLLAVWLVSHPRRLRRWQVYLAAGVLAGIATAARFHFAFVALPTLLALYAFADRPRLRLADGSEPRRGLYVAGTLLGALFM
jgi:4-amino-4-deoxy-L-arabinose transferase-like glycosyltransferase